MLAVAATAGIAMVAYGARGIYRAGRLRSQLLERIYVSVRTPKPGIPCIVKLPGAGVRITKRHHNATRVDAPIYVGGAHVKVPIGGSIEKVQVIDSYGISGYPSDILPSPLTVYPSDRFLWSEPVSQHIGSRKYYSSEGTAEPLWYYGRSDGQKLLAEAVSDSGDHLIRTVYESNVGMSRVVMWIGIAILVLMFIFVQIAI